MEKMGNTLYIMAGLPDFKRKMIAVLFSVYVVYGYIIFTGQRIRNRKDNLFNWNLIIVTWKINRIAAIPGIISMMN